METLLSFNTKKEICKLKNKELACHIHNIYNIRVLLKIFDAEFPYKLFYFEPLCLLNKMAAKTVKRPIPFRFQSAIFKRNDHINSDTKVIFVDFLNIAFSW